MQQLEPIKVGNFCPRDKSAFTLAGPMTGSQLGHISKGMLEGIEAKEVSLSHRALFHAEATCLWK
jgi:hypothetical protein